MGNYATVAEVRAEGGTGTDDRINARIDKWEAIVEQFTQNVFHKLEPGELRFDGNNMDTLYFNLPLIEVTALRINSETVALPADQYFAYTRRGFPQDDRRNPRIVLTPTSDFTSPIFRAAPAFFLKGYWQYVTAKWGFVEEATPGVYTPPRPIKDAVIQLVILDLENYFEMGLSGVRMVTNETTDGHSMSWSTQGVWSLIPDKILDVLKLYRRPPIITAPDPNVVVDPALVILDIKAW